MKKILILILFILLLTGCGSESKDLDISSIENEVRSDLLEVSNIEKQDITDNLNILISDYSEKTSEDVLYAAIYIRNVSEYLDDSKINDFARDIIDALSNGEDGYENSLVSDIEDNKDEYINDMYVSYHTKYTFKELFTNLKLDIMADVDDDEKVTYDNIDDAISYIEEYLDNPLENNETSERLAYDSLFLSMIADNVITELGSDTMEYLLSFDSDDKNKVLNDLEVINKNKEKYIKEYLKEVWTT